ncbi:carbohydrate ABC transporter permease [Ilumatobacter coccineus]|jgi:sn-glycerol 3-phosphate transport system permease protein|uniref:Putative ABC transporter permease protein n=1 Tax=Ilumatobacter coccineus (strain NBRC 103263 / KCTC 29153 / YM16-304) TaxID=1313172 RepID=A0A6C7EIJ7_ILUCY|nr:carbohydrate ABC transporter permease [Ilumatobacter coccineus]BAN03796.1 putative ABC transporter permease protein [Ilumatobacter coccineus YM16-304]
MGEFNMRSALRPKSSVDRWYTHLALISTVCLIGFPLIYAIVVSTQSNTEYFSRQLTPGSSLRDNFDVVWRQRDLGSYMMNSIVQAVIITIGKTITAMLAGLAFVHFDFRAKWFVFWFVLVTLMMPTEISIIALFQIVGDLGWSNSMLGLTVPFLASATGAFLFRQHFAKLPAELSDAARIDGAGPVQFLFRILLPLSWNVIGALAVIQFLYSWNMYLWPRLVINDQSEQVVQIGLGTLRNVGGGQSYGPLMLGAVIASIPPTLVFVLLQRTFLKGFSISADK